MSASPPPSMPDSAVPRPGASPAEVARWNDELARAHDIDDYYERSHPLVRLVEARRLRLVRELLAVRPGDRLLEVGCGGGHVLRQFPEAELTGVDPSAVMLAKAERNLRGLGAKLLRGELAELDLPAESFDRVICTEVLEHVVEPERLLAELARLLRPAGRAVITLPNDRLINAAKALVVRSGVARLPGLSRLSWGGDRYHLHVWPLGEMRALLRRHLAIVAEGFAPSRLLPVRCCFACTRSRP